MLCWRTIQDGQASLEPQMVPDVHYEIIIEIIGETNWMVLIERHYGRHSKRIAYG